MEKQDKKKDAKTSTESQVFEGTRVDLGDDLLEASRKLIAPSAPVAPESIDSTNDPADLLQNARILLNEGFTEDAKRALRKILVRDLNHWEARKLLDQIHELELKQIFGSSPAQFRRRMDHGNSPERPESLLPQGADQVLRKLDQDVGLGLYADRHALFGDPDSLEKFGKKLDSDMAVEAPRDRIDLGIAFLEMGLPEIAVPQFRSAFTMICKGDREQTLMLASITLLAYALIVADRGYEAIAALQPVVRDSDVARENKVELYYLMGRAYEALHEPDSAAQWYQQAKELDPHYRDISERLREPQEGP